MTTHDLIWGGLVLLAWCGGYVYGVWRCRDLVEDAIDLHNSARHLLDDTDKRIEELARLEEHQT